MSSRLKLYAQLEPFGECATQRGVGKKIIYGMGGGGGSSSSSSSTATTTQNSDMRVVGGNDSVNLSAQDSTVSLVTTDRGAVNAAFGFADFVSAQAFDFAHAAQIDTSKTVTGAMEKVADAYSTAKAGEQKIFAGAALAVVGVVAAIAMKRG